MSGSQQIRLDPHLMPKGGLTPDEKLFARQN